MASLKDCFGDLWRWEWKDNVKKRECGDLLFWLVATFLPFVDAEISGEFESKSKLGVSQDVFVKIYEYICPN